MDADFPLILRMKNGDDQAIDTFVRKYYPVILRYCRLHMNDIWLAEDATQETFVRFFRTLNQYKHYGKAVNYLYVIASNICKDYYKKSEDIPTEEIPELPVYEMDDLNVQLDVRLALQKLPPELQEVIILYFYQEVKQKEIAKILGIGLPLVKYRIKRAKELLHHDLGKEELR